MLTQIAVNRATGEGEYADVIDACDYLSMRFGSASNALVQIARESPLFLSTIKSAAFKSALPEIRGTKVSKASA